MSRHRSTSRMQRRSLTLSLNQSLAAVSPPTDPLRGGLAPPGDDIAMMLDSDTTPGVKPSSSRRVASIDILRGICIGSMIFVDEVGKAYPHIDHSPWNNITLADFVMPWFLFIVGMSIPLSIGKFKDARWEGLKHVLKRGFKLYGLGIIMQGGHFFDGADPRRDHYSYGYNIRQLRFCGILNRIAFAYVFVAVAELFLPGQEALAQRPLTPPAPTPRFGMFSRDRIFDFRPHLALCLRHRFKWLLASMILVLYLCLTYLLTVPTWQSEWGRTWSTTNRNGTNSTVLLSKYGIAPLTITCDVSGAIDTPECTAAGMLDRMIFGQQHLGVWMSARMPECSSCSPSSDCPPAKDAPAWCFAKMYDPEGFLSTINTVTTTWIGAYYGHVVRAAGLESSHRRVVHWLIVSVLLVSIGSVLHVTAVPMNKQLWTPSYAFFMAGTCGFALVMFYLIEISSSWKSPIWQILRIGLFPFECMGQNAILIFLMHGPSSALIDAVYWTDSLDPSPGDERINILSWLYDHVLGDSALAQIEYTSLKITILLALSIYLRRIDWYLKV